MLSAHPSPYWPHHTHKHTHTHTHTHTEFLLNLVIFPLRRIVWRLLKKLKIELPYDPGIPLLGMHTEDTRIDRITCAPMFIAALLIIARTWKQPRSPSAN